MRKFAVVQRAVIHVVSLAAIFAADDQTWDSFLRPLHSKYGALQHYAILADVPEPCNTTVPESLRARYPWATPLKHSDFCSVHEGFVGEIERHRQMQQEWDMVWFGDSIFSSLRWPWGWLEGNDVEFQEHTEQYKAQIFGMGLDTSMSLMWRLLAGGTPTGVGVKLIVVHIGVNDLWAAIEETHAVLPEVSIRLKVAAINQASIAHFLLSQDPHWQVLFLGPLPPTSGTEGDIRNRNEHPNYLTPVTQHYDNYLKACLNKVNKEEGAAHRVHYVSCWDLALTGDGRHVDPEFTPDGWHPGPQGWSKLFSSCLGPKLQELMGY